MIASSFELQKGLYFCNSQLNIPMKNIFVLFILFFSLGLSAQSVTDLEKQLSKATSVSEKLGLKYQIATILVNKDKDKAEKYAKEAFKLAQDKKDVGMQAEVSYLLGRIYEKKRNDKNAKVWYESSLKYAKQNKNVDFIVKSVEKISDIYVKDRKFRDAYNVAKDAFQYFSTTGMTVGQLQSNYDVQKAKITRQERDLLKQKAQLEKQISILERDRSDLSRSNSNLSRKTKELEEEKVQIQDEKLLVEEEKERIEEVVNQQEDRISNLSARQLKAELKNEKLARLTAESESNAKEAKMQLAEAELTTLGLAGLAGFLVLMALLFYSRYRTKKKSAKELEDKNLLIEEEKQRSDELLLNILPAPIAAELKEFGQAKAQKYNDTTVLFTDFINFTSIAEKLTPEKLVEELDTCFKAFDFIISQYEDIEKIKTIGDAYMAASGLVPRKTLPTNMVKAALEMQEFLEEIKAERQAQGLPFFEARIGLHTGPVVAGVVGVKKFAYDIWGDTVNIAARMEANCEAGRVNISETTRNLVQYKFSTTHRGKIMAKNKGEVDMYYVS